MLIKSVIQAQLFSPVTAFWSANNVTWKVGNNQIEFCGAHDISCKAYWVIPRQPNLKRGTLKNWSSCLVTIYSYKSKWNNWFSMSFQWKMSGSNRTSVIGSLFFQTECSECGDSRSHLWYQFQALVAVLNWFMQMVNTVLEWNLLALNISHHLPM